MAVVWDDCEENITCVLTAERLEKNIAQILCTYHNYALYYFCDIQSVTHEMNLLNLACAPKTGQ